MTPEQLKKVCVYLAFGLIVALAWIVFDCQGDAEIDLSKDSKISRLEQKDRENQKLQASQDSITAVLRHSIDSTSKASRKSDSLFVAEKNARKQDRRELFALRAASGVKVDTVTLLIEGNFQAQIDADSIQIHKLEARILSDSTNYTGIIQSWVTKFDSQVQVSDAWRIQAVKSTQDAQKYKRQRNTATLIAVIEALLIVLIAVL